MSDKFTLDIGHSLTVVKIKMYMRLRNFSPFTTVQTVGEIFPAA